MDYPDFDPYLPKVGIPPNFEGAGRIANMENVIRVSCENEQHLGMERGFYLKFPDEHGKLESTLEAGFLWLDLDLIS